MDPLTVTVLQASSQLPRQLTFVHVAVEIRQRVQHHDLTKHSAHHLFICRLYQVAHTKRTSPHVIHRTQLLQTCVCTPFDDMDRLHVSDMNE